MPFTSPEDQAAVEANGGIPITVGDMCRKYYVPMVEAWRAAPRWTTAHNIYQGIVDARTQDHYLLNKQELAARELAWQVFFQLYVMPYELEKREQNGDIDEQRTN